MEPRALSPAEERALAMELKENQLFWNYIHGIVRGGLNDFEALDEDRVWVRANQTVRVGRQLVRELEKSLKRPDEEQVA